MTPFSNPHDRAHVTETIPVHAEAAAKVLTQAAKRIRSGESVRDVCGGLIDVVMALSGRV
jgi:hypothetical protein